MGMGYGVLTPVLKPKIFFGLAGREREKLTRRLESTGGAAAKKLKKPVFTLSHEIAALFGEQTRLARETLAATAAGAQRRPSAVRPSHKSRTPQTTETMYSAEYGPSCEYPDPVGPAQ